MAETFDASWYARTYPGAGAHPLRFHRAHGEALGFSPTPPLQEAQFLARYPNVAEAFGETAPSEPQPSLWFDSEWYLRAYPDVAAAVARGEFRGALHHYLTTDKPTEFDPSPFFSEQFYLARHPDVRDAVAAGERRNGFLHFLDDGAREIRQPRSTIDLAYYRASYPDASGLSGLDLYAHYIRHAGARAASPSAVGERPSEHAAKSLWRMQAEALLPLYGRAPLDFTCNQAAALSVVMVLHNQMALTLMALASLRESFAGAVELILIDSGSADETVHLARYVRGARLIRLDANVGFVRACNAGLYSVTAPFVLFLNTDVTLGPGAVAAALRRMADPAVGVVGGKVVRAHGLLQEAGCIVWRGGVTEGYLRDAEPAAPEAGFARDVDYVSGCFLMARADALERLDGFDDDYAPAYYEDADLCLRIAALGLRVVYDPAVVVHHLEYGSAGHAESQTRMTEARAVFARKHDVESRPEPSQAARLVARFGARLPRRVLMIEDHLPIRRLGSGFVRSNDILHAMQALGWAATVFPVLANRESPAAVYADMPDGVEAMHDGSLETLDAFAQARAGYYDVVWVSRTHNLDRTLDAIRRLGAPVVLDTEAVAATRSAARARLRGKAFDEAAALAREFANAGTCARVVAVNDADAQTLHAAGLRDVAVLGHARVVALTPKPWAERTGILFVGAIHEVDSPNYDGLAWFVDEVLPLIEPALGWRTRLTVIGHLGEGVNLDRFAGHPRVTLRGPVAVTESAYDSHRVFIAPTRWAGGAPYKVHEAASFGLPVVATTLIRSQLGWGDEVAAADDAAAFAGAVLRLHESEAAWAEVRESAAARVSAENDPAVYAERVRRILEGVLG